MSLGIIRSIGDIGDHPWSERFHVTDRTPFQLRSDDPIWIIDAIAEWLEGSIVRVTPMEENGS